MAQDTIDKVRPKLTSRVPSHSHKTQVFLPTLRFLLDAAEEDDDKDADVHTASQITALFLDWTDPQKSVYVASPASVLAFNC